MSKARQKVLVSPWLTVLKINISEHTTRKYRRVSSSLSLGMVSYLKGNPFNYCIKVDAFSILLFFSEFCTGEQKLYHGKIYNVMKFLH